MAKQFSRLHEAIAREAAGCDYYRDVLEVLTPIWHAKHETARRVKQRISEVCEWPLRTIIERTIQRCA